MPIAAKSLIVRTTPRARNWRKYFLTHSVKQKAFGLLTEHLRCCIEQITHGTVLLPPFNLLDSLVELWGLPITIAIVCCRSSSLSRWLWLQLQLIVNYMISVTRLKKSTMSQTELDLSRYSLNIVGKSKNNFSVSGQHKAGFAKFVSGTSVTTTTTTSPLQ